MKNRKVITKLKNIFKRNKRVKKILNNVEQTINAVEEVDSDVNLASDVVKETEDLTSIGSKILKGAADIPVPVTRELKPVAEGVSALDKVLKKTVVPGLGMIASLLGTVTVLLAVIQRSLTEFKKRNTGLATSFEQAESVTDQIIEKFGERIPQEMEKVFQALETTLDKVEDKLEPLEAGLNKVDKALAPLSPVVELAALVHPAAAAIGHIHVVVDKFLKKNGSLLRNLKKAIDAFETYKKRALSHIEATLKKAHIDISFIDSIDREIHKLVDNALDQLLTPVKKLEKKVKDRLTGIEAPIEKLHKKVEDVLTHSAHALEPLKKELDLYVAAAGKIGIHPR